MQESLQSEEKVQAERALAQEYASEMTQWVDLTNRLSAQIEQLRSGRKAPSTDRQPHSNTAHVDTNNDELSTENARLREENRALRAQLRTLRSAG